MAKKKATGNFSGIAMGVSFICIVAIGVAAVVLKGQEASSGGISARIGMLDAGYRDLRAQVVAQAYAPQLPPPAPISNGPIIRVGLNNAMTDPIVFRANAARQTMASFTLANESDNAVRVKKVNLIVQPHQPMSSVKAYLAQGLERDQIGSAVTVPDQESAREISFSKSSGIQLAPHQTAILNIVAKPSFSAATGREGITLKSIEIFGTLPSLLTGQDLSTSGGAPAPTSSVPAPTLSISTSSDNVPAQYLAMGSTDQVLYKLRLTAGSAEDVRVREISLRDSIENNAPGLGSFFNFRLYDESNSSFAGPVNIALSGTGIGTVGFTETRDFNIVVPKNGSRTLVLKADVANFVSGAAKSGSRHTFGIASASAVSAFGKDSALAATVSGTPSGTPQDVYRTKPRLTTAVIGSPVGRTRVFVDDIATLNWGAVGVPPDDSLSINTVMVRFAGPAIASGSAAFSADLIDANTNINWGNSIQQVCVPSGGSCSVTFGPRYSVSRDVAKQVRLRVNSANFANASTNPESLAVTISAASSILWSDGTTNGIVWNAGEPGSTIPITVANISYE